MNVISTHLAPVVYTPGIEHGVPAMGLADNRPRGAVSPRGIAVLGLALGAALALGACGESQWTATVYPDREDLNDATRVGVFEGLDQCRAAATDAIALLEDRSPDIIPGWECGRSCRVDDDGDLRCDKYEQG